MKKLSRNSSKNIKIRRILLLISIKIYIKHTKEKTIDNFCQTTEFIDKSYSPKTSIPYKLYM